MFFSAAEDRNLLDLLANNLVLQYITRN